MDRVSDNSPAADGALKTRRGLTAIEWIVILAIIGILVALLLPASRSSSSSARRTQCKSNLKQIVLALHNYKDDYHVFPPAYTVDGHGKPLHSWRTLILPYLEQQALYNQIDLSKPWDDPVNAKIGEKHLEIYSCPASRSSGNSTTYLAMVTPESPLRPAASRDLLDVANPSEAVMVIEVHPKQAVPWMSPRDADAETLMSLGPKSDLPHEGGLQAAFVDGSVRFIPGNVPEEEKRAMLPAAVKKK